VKFSMTTAIRDQSATPQSSYGRLVRFNAANVGFTVAILILLAIASIGSDVFLTERNLVSISRQLVTNGLLSLGMLLVILTGGIDLSVGPVVAFAGLLATGLQAHMPFPVAIAAALAMGLTVGLFNGFMIARFKLQPFIVTLATMGTLRGLLYVYSETPNRSPVPKPFGRWLHWTISRAQPNTPVHHPDRLVLS
jgi:ribose transport system permease protein